MAAREDAPKRILVIDDNVDLAQNIAEILEDLGGVEVEIASSGSAGLEKIAASAYSLVVTDMRMPGMNGLDVIRYIKARWPALPVVVMTAYARDELLDEARNEGALRVMIKGVDIGEVTRWIARLASGPSPILVVEDDDAMRTNLVEVLQDLDGVVPHPARDGATARKLAKTCRPRGAVVDLRLPDADGLELAQQLRDISGTPGLPVLYISGYVADIGGAVRELLADERMRLLEKPFDPEELIETVGAMLGEGG
jgi:CheY-like chemotaxis protein